MHIVSLHHHWELQQNLMSQSRREARILPNDPKVSSTLPQLQYQTLHWQTQPLGSLSHPWYQQKRPGGIKQGLNEPRQTCSTLADPRASAASLQKTARAARELWAAYLLSTHNTAAH